MARIGKSNDNIKLSTYNIIFITMKKEEDVFVQRNMQPNVLIFSAVVRIKVLLLYIKYDYVIHILWR